MHPMRRAITAATAALSAFAISPIAAAQSSGSSGASQTDAEKFYTSLKGLSADARQNMLEAQAKKEGQLTVYTSDGNFDEFKSGFQKKYPYVTVNVYRADQTQVLQRALREAAANRVGNDITDATIAEMRTLAAAGVTTPYDGPALETLRPEAKTSPYWTAVQFGAFTVGWNTEIVKPGSEPKSFTDLLDPKWKGKIGMMSLDYVWYATLLKYFEDEKKMSEQDAKAFFGHLATNSKVLQGHTMGAQLLGIGQVAIEPSLYAHNIDYAHYSQNMPIAREPIINPFILEASGQAIMKDAPHPASAFLFTDWMLTEGQKLLVAAYRLPTAMNVPGAEALIPSGAEIITIPEDVYVNGDRWRTEYNDLLRSAAAAK